MRLRISWHLGAWTLVPLLTGGALTFPDGPPPAHTGGFGEPTCRHCHNDGAPLGAPDGSAEIAGLPAAFEPGRTYDITIVVRKPQLARAGFELAVRYAAGENEAGQAGVLAPADPVRVALDRDTTRGVTYARHTRAGNRAFSPGELRWVVRWTAPDARHPVVFNAATVAANDDNSNFGDEVYARAQVVPPVPH